MSTHTHDEIGTDFVGYRIEALLGRGGMGVVYRAYDLRLRRMVALKLVAPELALDERFRARFARESELAMSLEHPNVVPIYDAGEVDGRLYLAMRHVEGTDLRALLRAEGRLEPTRALAIVRQIGNALDAAHANGLVHRDVKPSNVLLDQHEHVYLADLGLTRRLEEQARAGDDRSVGTPAYLAPEQIEGRPVDGRADVYSLGCLFYECLTGQPPFAARSRLAVAWAHLEEEPPNASERNRDVPPALDAVIRKAIAKDPDERYPTCAGLIADAEAALGLRRPLYSRRRLPLVAAAALVALAGAAVAAALVLRSGPAGNAPTAAVRPNTLVRIDPVRNAISNVTRVGLEPMASAVGGRSVWVYNRGGGTVTEIDPSSNAVRQQLPLSAAPLRTDRLSGPVLAADAAGAWLVGTDSDGKGFLTRLSSRRGGKHEFRLGLAPEAVAVGKGSVWVGGHGSHGDYVLRVDPATGEVRARTRIPASRRIDSLAVGLGAVYAVASSTGLVYRIDPRSSRLTTQRDLGGRVGRPLIRFGTVWVPVLGHQMEILDPRTLDVIDFVCCPDRGATAAGYGSAWLADVLAGEVVRFDADSKAIVARIPVVTGSPIWGHPCLSSIAAGGGGVWVTVIRASSVLGDPFHRPPCPRA